MSYQKLKERARQLRKNMTSAEQKLWQALRKRRLDGYKFLRQHPVVYDTYQQQPCYFIADFYCAQARLVVEVDGPIHDRPEQKEYDRERDFVIRQLGLKVIRIRNNELKDMEQVKNKIRAYL